ncbi:stomatin-like [Elgaria multicarinata webbii]|uniref:stomatin-like n=1 Tax=Elgaria multicarinata webbii TaxID=159646 RepID=UPI002FCD1FD3
MCLEVVMEYERAVIFRLGHIRKGEAKAPGVYLVLPCIDHIITVDMRTISFDIPPQEVLTKDSMTIIVDGVVYYRVQNAILSVTNIAYSDLSTRLLAQTTLRNVLGTKNLCQILSDREEIAHSMQATLDVATDDWGIKVERVEIKDVKLPLQLQRAMAAEAEAAREARAKVIAAEGEMNASKALKEAAIVMTESPAALQLRYLQTLTTIAAEKNSTIVFPLPIDMLQGIMRLKQLSNSAELSNSDPFCCPSEHALLLIWAASSETSTRKEAAAAAAAASAYAGTEPDKASNRRMERWEQPPPPPGELGCGVSAAARPGESGWAS